MATKFHSRERRKSLYDPSYGLFRTHQFDPDATGLVTGDIFPDRTKAVTFAVTVKRTDATPTGIVLEFGDATTGLAIWFAEDDGKIYAAAGDGALDDGVTLDGIAPPDSQIIRIVFAVIPASGKARLWLNGQLVAAGEAAGGELPNGWAAAADGAIGAVDGAVTTRVPVADRITLDEAAIVSPVNAFHNQRPRQFFEASLRTAITLTTLSLTATGTDTLTPQFDFSSGTVVAYKNGDYHSTITTGVAGSIAVVLGDIVQYVASDWNTVTVIDMQGDSVSGDISGWTLPSSLTDLLLLNTSVSGNVSGWILPSSLVNLYLYNTSISGDISSWVFPSSLVNLYLRNTTVSGDISSWVLPSSLEILRLDSTSVSGDISGWTLPSSSVDLRLYITSVSGDISSWALPSSLVNLLLYNTNVSGDISGWTLPSSLANLLLQVTSVDYASGGSLTGITSSLVQIDLDDCAFSQTEVDAVLGDCVASTISGKTLEVAGSNSAPSVFGEADKTTLVGNGWTVTTTAP